MLTDSERFTFETRRHHAFASTGSAYDATRCDEAIKAGDTLVVLGEGAVGAAMTWPFAVTAALHVRAADFRHAADLARRLGLPLDPQLEPLLGEPAG